jgi:hypothetical protein
VPAGERAYASADLMPSTPYPFNSAVADDFDRWPAAPTPVSAERSSEYLPSDLQTYAPTLDAYGDWGYLPAYGYVWYPRVSHEWRPYAYGRWMTYSRYGLTWVGTEAFAWPTHHYGRWTTAKGQWCWIPASQWSPAHVAWSSTGDSVSWSPLGPANRASQPSGARTVVSRADFDRRAVVPDTRVIDQTRIAPIDQSRVAPIIPAGAAPPPRPPATRFINRGDDIMPSHEGRANAPAVPRVYVMPARTTPPLNPVPRAQPEVRGQRPAPAAAAPAPAPAPAAPPPTRAWQTQPQPAKPAAQQPPKQSPPPSSATPSNGTAVRRGRGGV